MASLKIITILRGIEEKHIEPLLELSYDCGIKEIEITMNTPNVLHLIRKMKKSAPRGIIVGAGTVTSMKDLIEVLNSGAEFIVTPIVKENVIIECKNSKIPIYPGALTPTEIHRAWQLGADMVKVFPASAFGPAYFKDLKGPFNHIKLMAVGGVHAGNVNDYIQSGADGIAVGGSIFKKEWITEGKFDLIRNKLKELTSAAKAEQKDT